GGLLLLAATVAVLILIAAWMRRTRAPHDDLVDEIRTIDRGDAPGAPRRWPPRARRAEPADAVQAYVALLADLARHPAAGRRRGGGRNSGPGGLDQGRWWGTLFCLHWRTSAAKGIGPVVIESDLTRSREAASDVQCARRPDAFRQQCGDRAVSSRRRCRVGRPGGWSLRTRLARRRQSGRQCQGPRTMLWRALFHRSPEPPHLSPRR